MVWSNKITDLFWPYWPCLYKERTDWVDLLPFFMLAYNLSVPTTTGFTPYRLVVSADCVADTRTFV